MADYIYLLEHRLSIAQRNALRIAREVAQTQGLTIFLVGGAVRDLTSGSPVRDLDVAVQGNALKSKREFEKAGAVITGENDTMQALYLRLPGHVRMEFGSTLTVSFPKPGKPSVKPGTILEDLRRRDFTVNAMALSLNEGSYGLLMDPLNGTADIEDRHLRLVSNYGFIEDPVRMIRAARLMARLGWMMDEKTQLRYETGKQEGYVSALSEFHRGYELEEIFHEEDPLRVVRRLEAEGWMKLLSTTWSAAKINTTELERLREAQTQLEMQNLHPDSGAANFPLLTAKLSAAEVTSLKASFPRQGFVKEINALEGEARQFAAQLSAKTAALPSQAWKLITSAPPEAVLWVAYSNKSVGVQSKLKAFATEWPQARQKMPYTQMQEMRIIPDLPGYEDLLERLFFELMDGKLQTTEEMKAFLEPYSPPAPPPPVNLRRMRAAKKEPKPRASKAKAKATGDAATTEMAAEVNLDSGTAALAEKPKAATAAAAKNATSPAGAEAVSTAAKQTGKVASPTPAKKTEKEAPAAKSSKSPSGEAEPVKPSVSKASAPEKTVPVSAAKKAAVTAKKVVKVVAPAKKSPAGKAALKKTAVKKTIAPKATGKKNVVAKQAVKKSSANRQPAKKAVPTPAKKAPAKKAPVKSTTGKPAPKGSQPAKKSRPAKKSTPAQKTVQKSSGSSKNASKKTSAKSGRRR